MKLVILGDLHLGIKDSSDVMFRHQKRFFRFLFDYMAREGIETILQLGDIFDNRKYVNFKTLKFAREEVFAPMAERGVRFHTLVGNHDVFYRDTNNLNSPALILSEYDNVTVYSSPTTVEFGGKHFDFIPWICKENSVECLRFIADSVSEYCLGHFELNNFLMYAGAYFSGGLNPDVLKNYERVFSGHFHIKSKGGNVIYTGTPYELNWNDAGTEKGFYVLDTEQNYAQYVRNPDSYYKYLRYDEERGEVTDVSRENLEDCFLRIVVVSKREPYLYENFIQSVYKQHPADVKFIESTLIAEGKASIARDTRDAISSESDTATVIAEYIDGLDIEEAVRTPMKKFVLELYQEALTQQDH